MFFCIVAGARDQQDSSIAETLNFFIDGSGAVVETFIEKGQGHTDQVHLFSNGPVPAFSTTSGR